MADLSIRGLDDEVRELLRRRTAANGRSMEAEARAILSAAVRPPDHAPGFLATLHGRFQQLGGVELELPERSTAPRAARFEP